MSMEKYVDKIGVGVEISDVIVFQTRLMMGVQFERLIAAKVKQGDEKKREVLIACLRLGWNDAFRHTSKNVMDGTKSVLEKESAKYNKEHKQEYDDYICGKILEDEKFYPMMRVQYQNQIDPKSAENLLFCKYGKHLLEQKHEVLKLYLEKERMLYEGIKNSLQKQTISEKILKRSEEVEEILNLNAQAYLYF